MLFLGVKGVSCREVLMKTNQRQPKCIIDFHEDGQRHLNKFITEMLAYPEYPAVIPKLAVTLTQLIFDCKDIDS